MTWGDDDSFLFEVGDGEDPGFDPDVLEAWLAAADEHLDDDRANRDDEADDFRHGL